MVGALKLTDVDTKGVAMASDLAKQDGAKQDGQPGRSFFPFQAADERASLARSSRVSPGCREVTQEGYLDMSRIDGEELSPEELAQVAHKCGPNAWRWCVREWRPAPRGTSHRMPNEAAMRGSEFGEVLSAYPTEPCESPGLRRHVPLLSGRAVQAAEWTPVKHQQLKEKYIFLVRHAQSTWNREDLMKTVRHQKLPEISVKDVLSSAAHIATREVWHRDHPISDDGVLQSKELREKIRLARRDGPESFHEVDEEEEMRSSDEEERIRRFYQHFLESTQSIYCSPLLRALQTAHFALSDQDGWGSIKLLKEAREHFNFIFQRDCLGTDFGCLSVCCSNLVDRAVSMSKSLLSVDETDQRLSGRLDASDCQEKWWSDDPETEADVDRRLQELWRRLLEEDAQDSCILALLMRFGGGEGASAASPSTVASEEEDGYHCLTSDPFTNWQLLDSGPHDLQRLKVERLQNCGVLGLRCVLEAPLEDGLEEWEDLMPVNNADGRWVAKDALLMFNSVLVK
eukprot:s1308_g9.t1